MRRDKLIKLGLFALSASALAGCGDVTALPKADYYNQDLLINSDGTEADITNNTIKQLYDAIVTSGDTNSSTVLNNMLYIYSRSIFGSFFDRSASGAVLAPGFTGEKIRGIKSIVEEGTEADIQTFANTYSGFGGKVENVRSFYENVMYQVNTAFLGYTTNTTYQERNQFNEEKFYEDQVEAHYDLGEEHKSEYVQVYGFSRLTRDAATDKVLLDKYFANIYTTYYNYIELTLLPDIYRKELTTSYLQNQNFGTLRMSSARKVDYISLSETSDSNSIYNLMNSYCKIVINETGADASTLEVLRTYKNSVFGFTFLEALEKGTYQAYIDNISEAAPKALAATLVTRIYEDAQWTEYNLEELFSDQEDIEYVTSIAGENVYVETDLGSTINDYSKIKDDRFLDDTSVRADFTGSGAYNKETGLAIKYQELLTQNSTNSNWFMAGGLSGIPDSLQSRAFLVQLANEFEDLGDNTRGSYGTKVNGNYYLLPTSYETASNSPYLITETSDTSTTYYIVRIDEAVKGSRITAGSSDYYGDQKAWEVAHIMAYELSSNDSWTSAARTYFVDQMKVIFHDTDVYNYFKSTFPDIFDD